LHLSQVALDMSDDRLGPAGLVREIVASFDPRSQVPTMSTGPRTPHHGTDIGAQWSSWMSLPEDGTSSVTSPVRYEVHRDRWPAPLSNSGRRDSIVIGGHEPFRLVGCLPDQYSEEVSRYGQGELI
jgi:hypothetical protein